MDNKIYSKIFTWLFLGLLVTFGVGYLTLFSETMLNLVFSTGGYLIIVIAEVVVAIVLSSRIYKMQGTTVKILYLLYSALTGLTFSSIFIIYELESIIYVFLVTAIILGVFAFIGKNTKFDLGKIGTYLLMALFGIIILEVINIFWANSTLDMVTCIICLIVFIIYIAYDMQRVGRLMYMGIEEDNLAIMGAFSLYLDFINIFIRLLQMFGRRND